MAIIEMKNLSKYYGKNIGIENVSLEINLGDIYGIVGPNGAGKSTLIKLLLNFIFKSSGEGKIFGLDIEKDSEKIKERTSYVPSDVRYYREFTSEEICKLTMKFHNKMDNNYMEYIFEELDIDKDKKFRELSLGNRKKLSIASALVIKPELIILDEPTNGLDPLVQKNLFKLLKERVRENSTIFISSHNLKEIEDHCNKVAFIKKGKIIKEVIIDKNIKRTKVVNLKGSFDKEIILNLDNINEVKDNGNGYRFLYNGEIDHLIKELNKLSLEDISINNISLEEEFLGYYERGGEDDYI